MYAVMVDARGRKHWLGGGYKGAVTRNILRNKAQITETAIAIGHIGAGDVCSRSPHVVQQKRLRLRLIPLQEGTV